MTELRVLQHEYVFDHRLANCEKCELKDKRAETMCLSSRPDEWNGLMVIGEGPGVNESRLKQPFIGPSGNILNALLSQSGLDRKQTYVANAISCLTPRHDKQIDEDFPHAVPSCKPRLLEEIFFYKPRVIVALGRAALLALTGKEIQQTKREKIVCTTCAGQLTLPWYPCAHCKTQVPFREMQPLLPCPSCALEGGGMANHPEAVQHLGKKKMKCLECGGRKTREVLLDKFITDHRIDHVAGAVFDGAELGLPEVAYVIPSYHPSRILRKAETKAQRSNSGQFLFSPALEHFKKAERLLTRERAWNFGYRVFEQGPNQAFELKRWLDARIVTAPEGFYTADYFTIDLETDNAEPLAVTDIRCVGIAPVYVSNPQGEACQPIVVDTEGLPKDHPTVRLLCNFLKDRRVRKAGQNAILYDTQVLMLHWGVVCQSFTEDTLYAHFSIAPDENHDLQHIATTFTDTPAWKPPKNKNGHQVWESKADLHLYNARDVWNTSLSLEALRREMASEDSEFVYRLDIMKAHVARGMDLVGMPVDPEPYEALRSKAQENEVLAIAEMRDAVKDDKFNPNSPVQLAKALYAPDGLCRLVPKLFTDKGAPSTSADALFAYRDHPFVSKLLTYRKWNKILGTYYGRVNENGEQETGIVVSADWRIRCSWNPIGARTGRWSSSPNLQNWPEELRGVIGTNKLLRRIIVGADMPQAELRVIALLSGDDKLTELCLNADEDRKFDPRYDPHSYVCTIAFPNYRDLPEWEERVDHATGKVKKFSPRKALRDGVKAVIYGLNYGAGAATVHQSIMTDPDYTGPPLSLEMVTKIIEAIYTAFPKVRKYRERAIEAASKTGYVWEPLSRRRRVYPLLDVSPTEASNYGIQSFVATLIDMTMIELAHALPSVDPSAFIMAQVHDAIYIEADEDRAPLVENLLSEAMSQQVRMLPGAPFMPFLVKAKSHKIWSAH